MYSLFIRYLENLHASFSKSYLLSSTGFALAVGVIAAIFILVSVSLIQKNVALSVIAGIFQVGGAVSLQKASHLFLQMDLVKNTGDTLFFQNLLTYLIPFFIFLLLAVTSWVLTLSFILSAIGKSPAAVGAFSLLIFLFGRLIILPINWIAPIFGPITEHAQMSADILNYAYTLLPLLLIMLGAIAKYPQKAKQQAAKTV